MTASTSPATDDYAPEPRSIDLREYWLMIRRRWVIVLAATVCVAVLGLGYTFIKGPTYSATAQVLVAPVTQGPLAAQSQVSQQVNMQTEQAVAQSAAVVLQAARLLHIPPAALEAGVSKHLTVTVAQTTSDVLQITWQASSAKASLAGANAFANAYLDYRHNYLVGLTAQEGAVLSRQVASLQKQIDGLYAQVNASSSSATRQSLNAKLAQVDSQLSTANKQLALLPTYNDSGGQVIPGTRPLSPSGLGHAVVLVLSAILGLLLGVLLAFVRDAFDDRLRDAEQLERHLGAPTLAVLRRSGPAIATVAEPDSRPADAIRALRVTLAAVAARRDVRTMLIVAADASVSSARIVAELGIAIAESGRSVLLVGADMRSASLSRIFNVNNQTGLSDLLMGGGDPAALTRHPKQVAGTPLPAAVHELLALLPSGPQRAHALSVLDSDDMVSMLKSQRNAYDFVLLDSLSPAVAADIFSLAPLVDGVIVVGQAKTTKGRIVDDLRRRLDRLGAQTIGGVFIGKGRVGRHRQRSASSPPAVAVSASSGQGQDSEEREHVRPAAGRAPAVITARGSSAARDRLANRQ